MSTVNLPITQSGTHQQVNFKSSIREKLSSKARRNGQSPDITGNTKAKFVDPKQRSFWMRKRVVSFRSEFRNLTWSEQVQSLHRLKYQYNAPATTLSN